MHASALLNSQSEINMLNRAKSKGWGADKCRLVLMVRDTPQQLRPRTLTNHLHVTGLKDQWTGELLQLATKTEFSWETVGQSKVSKGFMNRCWWEHYSSHTCINIFWGCFDACIFSLQVLLFTLPNTEWNRVVCRVGGHLPCPASHQRTLPNVLFGIHGHPGGTYSGNWTPEPLLW